MAESSGHSAKSRGTIRQLDTKSFNDTISTFQDCIERYEEIEKGVAKSTDALLDSWKGKGRIAFEKNFKQVQLNLSDIREILYSLKDALSSARDSYAMVDSDIGSSLE